MSAPAYRLLGLVVWRGALWYLRRKLPVKTGGGSGRKRLLLVGGVVLAGAGAVAAVRSRRVEPTL